MGSPITFSGFNNIDFNVVLNAIIEQERLPITRLQLEQTALEARKANFATLATKLATLESAADALGRAEAFTTRKVTNPNSSSVTVSATGTTPIGTYDIVVNELARAQVTGTNSAHADKDTTIVATGGTLTIGGVDVTPSGDVTLQGLADAINATADIGVTASVVATSATNYQLVLTGNSTGTANGFLISNNLTGSTVTFIDTDGDNVSGDDPADNAVQATDASVTVNNIAVTSGTNVVEGAIPGASLTLLKKDPTTTLTVSVGPDHDATRAKVDTLISASNDLLGFTNGQLNSAASGSQSSIGRDILVRGLQARLSGVLIADHAVGGGFTNLAEVGLGFTRSGELTLDETVFNAAMETSSADVQKLFGGGAGQPGAFVGLESILTEYTEAGGLIPDLQTRLGEQVTALGTRIADAEARLELRREALQREFAAADAAMSRLNSQGASLSSLNSQFRLF